MDIRVPLFHKARTGAIHSWRVYVEGDTIYSEHGQVDGQKIISSKVATPKNVGRSNETSGAQQAMLEAQAMWTFKRDRKYSLTPEEAKEDVLLPMLAKSIKGNESYPMDDQPKLDGVRALARWEGDKVVLISRSGKPWLVTTHLNEQLEKLMPKGTVLDGEIYLHGKTLQWISSRTKKKQQGTELLEFHVYDCPESNGDDSLTWEQRAQVLENMVEVWSFATHIKQVETRRVGNKEAQKEHHDYWVDCGYEGLIGRVLDGTYEYGHRSPSLLKLKAFEDQEFFITGHTEGVGKEKGVVVWICKNNTNDLTFETRPKGTYEDRAVLFQIAKEFYGQPLTVRFIGRTESGLPHHAIGHAIRLKEDM